MNGPSDRCDRRPFRPTIGRLMILIAVAATASPVLRTGRLRNAFVPLLISDYLANLFLFVRGRLREGR